MSLLTQGQSTTINAATNDRLWQLVGASMNIETGAQFSPNTSIYLMMGSTLTMSGGSIDQTCTITLAQESTAAISGGTIGAAVTLAQMSTLTLSGGLIGHSWRLVQGSTLTIQGSNLVLDDRNPFAWRVTGTLRNGDALDLLLQVASNQNPHVVLQNG